MYITKSLLEELLGDSDKEDESGSVGVGNSGGKERDANKTKK